MYKPSDHLLVILRVKVVSCRIGHRDQRLDHQLKIIFLVTNFIWGRISLPQPLHQLGMHLGYASIFKYEYFDF